MARTLLPGESPRMHAFVLGKGKGAMMEHSKATKEKVREYMERRQAERRQGNRPPHDPAQVRREVGWDGHDRRAGDRRA